MAKNFDEIVKEEFAYLIEEHGFRLDKCQEAAGGYEILFTSKTTAVEINYEIREAYLFVSIFRLIDGNLIADPRNVESDSVLNGFSLDDILMLRNPDAMVKPAYKHGADSEFYHPENGLRLFVRRFAENLRNHASDMLSGDFQLFGQMDQIVKRRAKSRRRRE